MNFYITTGTYYFLKKACEKYPNENILLMGEDDHSILLHETTGKTVFNQPRKFEVVDAVGTFDNTGFAVLNHIPVSDEGRPLFEYRFKNRQGHIEKQPGFVALRILRPISSSTYVILTLWKNKDSFHEWKESESFQKSHFKPETKAGGQPINIFAGPSYVTTYSIAEEE